MLTPGPQVLIDEGVTGHLTLAHSPLPPHPIAPSHPTPVILTLFLFLELMENISPLSFTCCSLPIMLFLKRIT